MNGKGWIAVKLDSGAKIKTRPGNVKTVDDDEDAGAAAAVAAVAAFEAKAASQGSKQLPLDFLPKNWCYSLLHKKVMTRDDGPGVVVAGEWQGMDRCEA